MAEFKNYLEVKTTENARVCVRKESVGAVELVPGTSRTEAHLKLYIEGYAISIKDDFEAFVKKLDND